ncbi:hypothetical protein BJX65DRAFT_243479 [Aspergillus insuetus]
MRGEVGQRLIHLLINLISRFADAFCTSGMLQSCSDHAPGGPSLSTTFANRRNYC